MSHRLYTDLVIPSAARNLFYRRARFLPLVGMTMRLSNELNRLERRLAADSAQRLACDA